jgi:hypothetical protein
MRTVPLVASAVIGGAAVGLALFMSNLVDIRVEIQRAPTGGVPQPATVALPTPPQSTYQSESSSSSTSLVGDQGFVAYPNTPRQLVESANKLTAGGQLREAQELYLQVLLVNPDDQEAMQGLVRVRRLLARNNAAELRRQATTYRRTITQGKETEEHYTAIAMDLLAVASLQAAAELEDSSAKFRPVVIRSQSTAPKPSPTASKREAPRPKPQLTSSRPEPTSQSKPREVVRRGEARSKVPGPAPVAPKPVQKPPSPPPPPATLTVESESPVDMNEPFVTITVGPIASAAQASNITTELTVAGYVARMRWSGAEYHITLGPYRRSVAERIASRIRLRVKQGIPVSLNPFTN